MSGHYFHVGLAEQWMIYGGTRDNTDRCQFLSSGNMEERTIKDITETATAKLRATATFLPFSFPPLVFLPSILL